MNKSAGLWIFWILWVTSWSRIDVDEDVLLPSYEESRNYQQDYKRNAQYCYGYQ